MSTTEMSLNVTGSCPVVVQCAGQVVSSQLDTWQGYVMFAGLAIVAFVVARGSLAVRNRIYQDKVRHCTCKPLCQLMLLPWRSADSSRQEDAMHGG